ncbi:MULTISPECIES: hypothetical protein [unclassified Bradyrhizobium]|uniref:hypothetical protein n=1 Tax=unclassified Bradyrhizobium TaxID=2631580 RepID=UPI001FFB3091|nr:MULTISPECIES: hypothetical protein [unclassified Bradyrhizobium]MCK1536439.1 hypothetical protein [Bradyrhizobium sp. 176]MCK1556508.1 hypothetical protein [Bradyrhizobium sp. 171]
MPGNLSQVARQNNAPKLALLAPYVDSTELFSTRKFHPAFVRAVKANSGSSWPKPIWDQKDQHTIWGNRLIVHQPSRYCIDLLQLYAQIDPKLSLYRVHLALDVIQLYECRTYGEVVDVLKNLLHLRHRRHSDWIFEYEGTTYSIYASRRKSRPYRNLCVYNSKPSKITGEDNAVHVEIRMEKKRSVQAAGIFEPIHILSIKPEQVFAQFCVVKDHREKLEEITLCGIASTCKQYADDAPSYIEMRVRALNRRIGLHHVSVYAKHYPDRFDRLEKWDCFDFEDGLNWASADVVCDDAVRELRSLLPPVNIRPSIRRERPSPRERL